MALTLVTAPAAKPLTLAEAKAHLRVDGSDDDDLITALIAAATAHIDGRDGWLNRALVSQTWDLTLDAFPGANRFNPYGAIQVPLPPLISVTSITYVDTAGATQTLSSSLYTVDVKSTPGRIVPAYGKTWPSTRDQVNAVTVRFVAGYADSGASPADPADNVPQAIKQAMLLMIGHWYANREAVNVGNVVNEMPISAAALLNPFRVWSF